MQKFVVETVLARRHPIAAREGTPVNPEPGAARVPLDQLIEAIGGAVALVTAGPRIAAANQAFREMVATGSPDIAGKAIWDGLPPCLDGRDVSRLLQRVLVAGGASVETCEVVMELPPLGLRILQITARKVPTLPAALVAIEDVTEFRRSQSELALGTTRSEELNLAKSRFLSVASHDLRQPLQTLRLLRSALERKLRDDDAPRLVGKLGETLETMSRMLEALSEINQLESGAVHPQPLDFPVNLVLGRLQEEFPAGTRTNGVELRVVPCAEIIHSDPRLLEQIIRNLLLNAINHTDSGKILLGCRRRGATLLIEVIDTGSGIPEAELDAIFEEFHQLRSKNRPAQRGLGLGLAIVRRLVAMLDHSIHVRSRMGKGSTFTIEVPRR